MNARLFVRQLGQISLPDVFNPYRDACSEHDHSLSPSIRQTNLERYLDAVISRDVRSVWIGRDCGYRGARRTGIALTDEMHLEALGRRFAVHGISKATATSPTKERTATEVWKRIDEIDEGMFLWNVFPFHPFEPDNPMSNRRHTAREFKECEALLMGLLNWLRPTTIVALGADAHQAITRLGFTASGVRHPSYGGHIEFAAGMRRLYKHRCHNAMS